MLTRLPNEPLPPKAEWMEMMVVEVQKEEPIPEPIEEPPPEPPPEPKKEKPKPKPKPKPKEIDFEDIPPETVEAPPEEPPPPTKKKVQRVQGLSASSFANNGTTGLSVRAGTTLGTRATEKTIDIDEAKESTAISYAAATKQPRLKKRPPLKIPQSVIDAELEGTVQIVISIDETGAVTTARITKSLGPDADKACLDSWKMAQFKPALQGNETVAITNFPRRCRFKAMN
jgi:periplasmic protein TonB